MQTTDADQADPLPDEGGQAPSSDAEPVEPSSPTPEGAEPDPGEAVEAVEPDPVEVADGEAADGEVVPAEAGVVEAEVVTTEEEEADTALMAEIRRISRRALRERLRLRYSRVQRAVRTGLHRILPSESQSLFALTVAVGVLCGLAAVAFHLSIHAAEELVIDKALHLEGTSWVWWTLATPLIGGLLAGLAMKWLVPGAAGSGVPQVKRAFASEGGRIPLRDALGKFVLTTIQIGSGASLGREGPTVYICSAIANGVARLASLPPRNARRLTPVGVAAGIAAAFNAPIAAVTFTIEEIVGALDHSVLSGVVVAAAVAAVIERGLLGVHPVIQISETHGLDHASSLVSYALLGVVASFVSIAFSDGLLRLRRWFRDSCPLPKWTHPGLGGLMTGVMAVGALGLANTEGVAGGGYPTLSAALTGSLSLQVLLLLAVVKSVATIFSYSSGGVGGIFAPTLFVGAMVGGAVGYLDVTVFSHESHELGAFALVGMGALFAGVIRAPITSVLIIFEMTGSYELVLPLMLANAISYVVARRYRPMSIYEALLAQDGVVLPVRGRRPHPLEHLRVRDAMTSEVVCAPPSMLASEAVALLDQGGFALIPLDEGAGCMGRAAHARRIRIALASGAGETRLDALAQEIGTVRSDVPLLNAVVLMNELGVRQLVVIDAEQGERMVGILAMTDLVRAHARIAPPPTAGAEDEASEHDPSMLPELRASALAVAAPLLSGETSLHAMLDAVSSSPSRGVIIKADDGHCEVAMRDQLQPFVRDEDLQRMLRASDVAQPVPKVSGDTGFDGLVRVLFADGVDAIVVMDADLVPTGIVTRTRLANALLEWYVHELQDAPPTSWMRALRGGGA